MTTVDETGRPTTFGAVGAASGIHQQIDAKGGIAAVVEPFFATAPDSLATFGEGTERARASTFYPGATLVSGGLLVCGQIIEPNFPIRQPVCPPPAGYPLSVELPIPGQASTTDLSTPTSMNLSFGQSLGDLSATSASVHAAQDYVSSDSVIGDYDLAAPPGLSAAAAAFRQQAAALTVSPGSAASSGAPGLPGVPGLPGSSAGSPPPSSTPPSSTSAIHVGSAETHVRESFPDPNNPASLVVTSTSLLKSVDLMGGAIHIDSITATSSHQTDGVAAPVHHDQVTVGGVTVSGQAATIDQNGITVNGTGQGKPAIDALNAALQQLLAASGAAVRVVSPSGPAQASGPPTGLYSAEFGTGCTSGEADGVQVYLPVDARSVPYPAGQVYFANVTLASSCADGAAGASRISDMSVNGSGSVSGSGVTGGSAGSPGFSSPGTPGSNQYIPGTPGVSSGPQVVPQPSSAGNGRRTVQAAPAVFGFQLRNRLGLLYLSFTLGFTGVCLGFRQFAPARFPRAR